MDEQDLRLLRELQDGLPLVPEPFRHVAGRLGCTEEEVIARIRALMENGTIRKYRARINQRRAGITANALVAWHIPAPVNGTGTILASFPGVTHCYEREPVKGIWDYNLYTVHHGRTRSGVLAEVAELARQAGTGDYRVLFSTGEFKRAPAALVPEETIS